MLPAPGKGPSDKARANGFFRIDVLGDASRRALRLPHRRARRPRVRRDLRDARRGRAGLAFDRAVTPQRAGVLTPATALGDVLADRLRKAGHTYEVERLPPG